MRSCIAMAFAWACAFAIGSQALAQRGAPQFITWVAQPFPWAANVQNIDVQNTSPEPIRVTDIHVFECVYVWLGCGSIQGSVVIQPGQTQKVHEVLGDDDRKPGFKYNVVVHWAYAEQAAAPSPAPRPSSQNQSNYVTGIVQNDFVNGLELERQAREKREADARARDALRREEEARQKAAEERRAELRRQEEMQRALEKARQEAERAAAERRTVEAERARLREQQQHLEAQARLREEQRREAARQQALQRAQGEASRAEAEFAREMTRVLNGQMGDPMSAALNQQLAEIAEIAAGQGHTAAADQILNSAAQSSANAAAVAAVAEGVAGMLGLLADNEADQRQEEARLQREFEREEQLRLEREQRERERLARETEARRVVEAAQRARARETERNVAVERALAPAREQLALGKMYASRGQYADAMTRYRRADQLVRETGPRLTNAPEAARLAREIDTARRHATQSCKAEAAVARQLGKTAPRCPS